MAMEWPEFQMTAFTELLREIQGDASIVEDNETYVEVRSPKDLDDDKVIEFTKVCPYQVRVVTGLLHITEARLKDLAEHTGLEAGIVATEGKVEVRLISGHELEPQTLMMLAQFLVASLVSDQYAKTLKLSVNGSDVGPEIELSKVRKGSAKVASKMAPFIEKLQAELEKAIQEVAAEEEAEENQAKAGDGLTDESIEKLRTINSVEDLLNM
jgi:hypothetical protein